MQDRSGNAHSHCSRTESDNCADTRTQTGVTSYTTDTGSASAEARSNNHGCTSPGTGTGSAIACDQE
jgi:hypothetical protein